MKKIRSYATFEALGKEGNGLLIIIKKKTEENLQLQKKIIECDNDINIVNEIKLKSYKTIWKNVLHARFEVLIKEFTDSNTGQCAKKSSLKIMVKKSSVNNKSKIINIIKMKTNKEPTNNI